MSLHIVFVEPEIPPNTGNIARTCAATDTVLHLVKPLGFNIDDKSLKRAGLDYWPYVKLEVHESLDEFHGKNTVTDRTGFFLQRQRVGIFIRSLHTVTVTCSFSARKRLGFRGISLRSTKRVP